MRSPRYFSLGMRWSPCAVMAVCFAVALGLCAALSPRPAVAHSEDSGGIFIDHPVAMPAKAGGTSRLRLRLENETESRLNIIGLATPVAASAKLMVSVGTQQARALDSLSIAPNEELRAHTSHIWFELAGLNRDLVIGDRFPATLKFVSGREIAFDVLVSTTAVETD